MAAGQGTSLKTYLLTRLALVVPMVLILLTFVFLLMRVAPGDPISAALGGHVAAVGESTRSQEARLRPAAAGSSTSSTSEHLPRGLRTTITDQRPISDIILVNGAATLELTFAMIVAIVVGVPSGSSPGRFRDTPLDVGGRLFGIVIYACPSSSSG